MDFEPFPKLPRLARSCIITEKLDGTNAQVAIEEIVPGVTDVEYLVKCGNYVCEAGGFLLQAGSRSRWLRPEGTGPKGCDNFGFAAWVRDNAACLAQLGPGRHFGEWWGKGIQRGYGMQERYFSLFNAERWQSARPSCVMCVPVLYRGAFTTEATDNALADLILNGSRAAPGFMKAEGIVVHHRASNSMFKRTCEKDEEPKRKERDTDGNAAS